MQMLALSVNMLVMRLFLINTQRPYCPHWCPSQGIYDREPTIPPCIAKSYVGCTEGTTPVWRDVVCIPCG